MAEIHSIHDNLKALDVASMRITQAKAMATILAIATSSDATNPPASNLVSLALNGITALLTEAEEAAESISFKRLQEAA